jgi:hypothetical protein
MTTLIGRDGELDTLQKLVDRGDGGLILVLGAAGVGKRQLMEALFQRLRPRHQLLPEAGDGQAFSYITVDPGTEIGEFREQLSVDTEGRPSGSGFSASRVLFIYGYQPSLGFAAWFRSRFVPALTQRQLSLGAPSARQAIAADRSPAAEQTPTVVVLAAFESDVRDLMDAATKVITLNHLPEEVVRAYLKEVTSALPQSLTERELTDYAGLVAQDAGFLSRLERVLPLDVSEVET